MLCVLILAFIFLTPKSWFDNGEPPANLPHQNKVARTFVLIPPDGAGGEWGRGEIERRAREAAGQPEAQVTDVRRKLDSAGRTAAYEVDIR